MTHSLVRTIVVLAALLAVAAGGSTYLPAQTLLAAVAGILLVAAPPRGPIPRVPLVLAGLLFIVALLAFLPAGDTLRSVATTPWRDYIFHNAHFAPGGGSHEPYDFPLADTWTPQPWLTLQACTLLFVGLAWGLYLLAQPWEREDRVFCIELLVFGVAMLALLAALAFILNFHVPGWTQTENRGWFPNRNQTADVLALTGIAAYALIFDRLRKGKRTGYLLLIALVPIVVELVISYSRAGILLFFGGVLVWHLWPRPGAGRKGGSIKWLALSAALGIILLSIFLTFGGATLSRFLDSAPDGATTQDITDYRGAIQADALRFSLQAPVRGTGLGNFEPLFSFSRVDSINGNRAVHPESDWLWLAGEMGWGAVILVVAGYIWWLRRALPLENKAGESMRRALIVAALAFAVHGLVDVSGHRPGSLWVGLLVTALALPAREQRGIAPVSPYFFRGLGVVVLVIAAWWGGSLLGWNFPPTTATLDQLKEKMQQGQLPEESRKTATDALRIAPLDWSLYLQRGRAETTDHSAIEAAQQDFDTADALNPFWIGLPIDEGLSWAAVDEPGLGADIWMEGLHRAGPLAPEAYHEMAGLAIPHPIMRHRLAGLAFRNTGYLLAILPTSSPDEANALTGYIAQTDPDLAKFTPRQRAALFTAWWSQGDPVQMMALIQAHPQWESETWIYEARFAAKENDFRRACEICTKWARPPVVPKAPDRPLPNLFSDFQNDLSNLPAGLDLFLAEMQAHHDDHALDVLSMLRKIPGPHPAYLSYLEAQIDADKGDWHSAWNAWQDFLRP